MEMNPEKKGRLHFKMNEDLQLLREVLDKKPYADMNKWSVIHQNLNEALDTTFSLRAVKDRMEYLIKLYRKQDFINLRKSGTEEEYGEKEQLLQEILSVKEEFKPKQINSKVEGLQLRNKSSTGIVAAADVTNISDSDVEIYQEENGEQPLSPVYRKVTSPSSPPVARKTGQKRYLSQMFEHKQSVESEFQMKRLALAEKKVETDNRRVSFENERMERIQTYLEKHLDSQLEIQKKQSEFQGQQLEMQRQQMAIQKQQIELQRQNQKQQLELQKQNQLFMTHILERFSKK